MPSTSRQSGRSFRLLQKENALTPIAPTLQSPSMPGAACTTSIVTSPYSLRQNSLKTSWPYVSTQGDQWHRSVAAKFEYTAYSKLAAGKISNMGIFEYTYVYSNIHGHFVARYRIYAGFHNFPIYSILRELQTSVTLNTDYR